jgi:hypothetical protein
MNAASSICRRVGKGRRYLLAQCSDEHVGDAAHFKALCDQISGSASSSSAHAGVEKVAEVKPLNCR